MSDSDIKTIESPQVNRNYFFEWKKLIQIDVRR